MITRIEGMADNHALVFAPGQDGYWTAQVPPDLEDGVYYVTPDRLGCGRQQHLLRYHPADGGCRRNPYRLAGWRIPAGLAARISGRVGGVL